MNRPVRTRFAPSPTGRLHIGNARTAVMNWLFARHVSGAFVLRIEDTDRERSTPAFEASILTDLRWLGLDWDEGPDRGGPCGPYRQSERLPMYRETLDRLLTDGSVYPCYCSPGELEAGRERVMAGGGAAHFRDPCRDLTVERKNRLAAEGRRPAFRFRVDAPGVSFDDLIKGPIAFQGEAIGDFIVARADRMPMYNFACVTDDHHMGITHVVRGDDHVSNTPRQILLYRTLGWEPPAFAHLPMILGGDRVRLSKRHGATSVSEYRANGYLPGALVNFLSLLSWSSESGDEMLSRERLVREFDFGRVNRSAAVFDVTKLNDMNGKYIRQMPADALAPAARPFLEKAFGPLPDATVHTVVELLHERLETLAQVAERAAVFFREPVEPADAEAGALIRSPESQPVLRAFMDATDGLSSSEWDAAAFQTVMKTIPKKTGIGGKNLWMPVRAALTGQIHGPDLAGTVVLLGLEKTRKRIFDALGSGTPRP